MKRSIPCWRCSLGVKLPRRSSLRTRIENQISISLSREADQGQEACLGVKWKVMRWLASRRNASRVAIDWRTLGFPFSPRSSLMPERVATRRVTASDMEVLRLSQTTCHGAVGAAEANRFARNDTKSASVRVSPMVLRILPKVTSIVAISAFVPCRIYSNVRRSTCPCFIGKLGPARSRAWTPVISSIETVCKPCSAAVRRIAAACNAHGKLARGSAETEAQIEEYWHLGCNVLNLPGNDVSTYPDRMKARAGRAHARLKSIGVQTP
jgi:hypothetical protein